MIALLDNTVMSNFAGVKRHDVLRIAFGDTLATAQQTFDELEARGTCRQVAPSRLAMVAHMDTGRSRDAPLPRTPPQP